MLWDRLFSAKTGNQMKRWLRFQEAMNRKRWLEPDRERNGPITLFDFSIWEDAVDAARVDAGDKHGGWRITDDSVIGGYSHATLKLARTMDDYKRLMAGQDPIPLSSHSSGQPFQETGTRRVDAGSEVNEASQDVEGNRVDIDGADRNAAAEFVPFVRWKGTIDTRVNQERSHVQRSGFCSIRSPEYPFTGADLGGRYNGLEIMCRSDGRPYSLNLKVDSYIPDDLYQCFINIPPTMEPGTGVCPGTGEDQFDRVVLLFKHFIVTSGGRMRARQRDLDTSIKIQSIGITLMDGVDGDFEFDLARIRAVNYDAAGVIGQAD
jgi:Complex I intermediate-associated protein 30 (CIA30)